MKTKKLQKSDKKVWAVQGMQYDNPEAGFLYLFPRKPTEADMTAIFEEVTDSLNADFEEEEDFEDIALTVEDVRGMYDCWTVEKRIME